MRDVIDACLKNWRAPIPVVLKSEFLQYGYKNNINFIKFINIISNIAFLSYVVADFLVVRDVFDYSLMARSVFFVCILFSSIYFTNTLKNILLLELLLPLGIMLASVVWGELLSRSHSEFIPTYLYASVIFIVLLNIGIRVNFLSGLCASVALSGLIFYYVNRLNHSDFSALFVYTLVYVPVFLFSLFISWHVAYTGRKLFLYSQIEAMDKADLQDANRRLWVQSHTDSLTGVANRVLFDDRVQQAIAMAKRANTQAALMFIDLDKFKPVNDTYGHGAGDFLLQAVAKRLKACVRGSDTVARIGGDEFVVLLPEIDARQSAFNVAEKILDALNQPFELPEATVRIGASIGISTYPDHGQDVDSLRQQADVALYRAKERGRNRVEWAS
jgi:diguanylate cyclase (GGDEF)-like protein